ncbi:XrtA/PEP-CTERM system TPR-repeat protein PrsT [Catenovulum agarivorans]|uniref:XrtA/PEP-CTERM system TPR-repeat protein PrsT n=1 Tax=Catenovulum agarivorans TaxID=1172192 RepID=UPI0003191DEC|nr:XrtA/PEP-CTERM system TPR-repeat protein PrsT [Catenovulum agarivorans]
MKYTASILLAASISFSSLANDNHYESALQSFNQQDFDTAYIHLKNALQQNENHLPAKILYAKLLLQNSYYPEAVEEFYKAYYAGADINLIIEDWATALLLDKQFYEVIALGEGKKLTTANQFNWLMIQALAFEHLQQYDTALQSYQKARALQPNNPRILNSMAWNKIKRQDFTEAERLVEQSLLVDGTNPKTWHLKGKLAEIAQDFDTALAAYQTALKVSTNVDVVILRSLAGVHVQKDQLEQAQSYIEQILEQSGTDAEALLLQSWIFARQNDNEQASEIQKSLLEKMSLIPEEEFKQRVSLLFIRGLTAYAQGKQEQARSDLSSYIAQAPGDLQAIKLLVELYNQIGDFEQALNLLQTNEVYVLNDLGLSLKLSHMYLQNGQYYRADVLLNELRSRFPESEKVILLSAQALIARGKHESAVKLIEKSGLSDGEQKGAALELSQALLFMQSGAYDKALASAENLLKAEPAQVDYLIVKGASLVKLNRLTEAEVVLLQITEQQQKHFAARFNLAQVYKKSRRLEQAQQLLAELTVERPDNRKVTFMLAEVEFLLGNVQLASDMLSRITVLERQNVAAAELYTQVLLRQGKLEDALSEVNRLNELDRLNERYLWQRAQILTQLGRTAEASEQADVLFGLWAEQPGKLLQLSQLQKQLKDVPKVERSLKKAIALAPEQALLHYELIQLYITQLQINKAQVMLAQAAQQFKRDPNVLVLNGDLVAAQKNFESAFNYYQGALELNTSFVMAASRMYQLAKQGYFVEQVEQILQKLVRDNPNNALLLNLLADHYLNQQSNNQALAAYRQLITLDTNYANNPQILNNIANLYLPDNPQAAIEYVDKALAQHTTFAAAIDTKGWALYLTGQYEAALNLFRQAFAINSSDPSIRYHLGAVLVKLGRMNEAKMELQAALMLGIDFAEKAQCEQLLETL